MTLLRGKSVTYNRYTAAKPVFDGPSPIPTFSKIAPGDEYTESFGACSYRSLLDGPVDSGLLHETEIAVMGLRMDRKRAPAQLIQAITARELADAAQMGRTDKAAKAEIKREVRDRLNCEAAPKPSHGMLAQDQRTGILYLDGPSGASAVLSELVGLAPLYQPMAEYRKFLAWMAWRGGVKEGRATEDACPFGSASFLDVDREKIASFQNESIGPLLTQLLPAGWEMTRCSFLWSIGGEVATVTLDAANLKTTLRWPDEVLDLEVPKGHEYPLDWRLASRIAFISQFEEALAHEVSEFLRREGNNTLECDFEALFPSRGDALAHASGEN